MESLQGIVDSLLVLSGRLRRALEQDQQSLIATLLTERQGQLQALGEALQGGLYLSAELEHVLREADIALNEAARSEQAELGREMAALQRQQKASFAYRTKAPATFLDQLS
ncbi:hypothetical protein [Armatimonas sp.]|uniref:hypothetical protein n=1 Tax=Armatimonas sp. TaxID=1872638 RepID=UPI0037501560